MADIAPLAAGSVAGGFLGGGSLGGGTEPAELRVVAGPRDDWFAPQALDRLRSAVWEVTSDSNRSGLRLAGPDLSRARPGELPSEGMPLGALQVPPSGQPILFLADHPVTGGYPVIAVVATADIGRAAQLRPGDRVRFRVVPSPLG
jgi:allophanate hydrolase subunit 2